MTVGWKRCACLAWLFLIPFSGSAVTPMIAAGDAGSVFLNSDGSVWRTGRVTNYAWGVTSPVRLLQLPNVIVVATTDGADFALLADGTARGSFAASGHFAATYNVYVAAYVPILQSSTPWWQLDSNRSWGVLSAPMAEYLRGAALDSQATTVRADILQSVNLSQLGGTVFYVGYGTNMAEMLRAGRYRDIYTVPSQ